MSRAGAPRSPRTHPAGRAGFTLIEVMAVVFFTAIVLTAAITFYIDLTGASEKAMENVRATRRAVGILDRVARDLETAVLLRKPEETDPFEWPWMFVAEPGRSSEGADRLKFIHRGRAPRSTDAQESDLEVVAYVVESGENDDLEIWRWTSSQLPDGMDRSLPNPDDPGSLLLARGIAGFGIRFLDDEGGWNEEWDSTQLVRSGQLPTAAEIQVAVYLGEDTDETETLTRKVVLPVRPIDFAELEADGDADGDADDDDADDSDDTDTADNDDPDDCIKVSECIPVFSARLEEEGLMGQAQAAAGECAANYVGIFPGFDPSQCR